MTRVLELSAGVRVNPFTLEGPGEDEGKDLPIR